MRRTPVIPLVIVAVAVPVAPAAAAPAPAVSIRILGARSVGFHLADLDLSYVCRPHSIDALGGELVRPGSPRGSGAMAAMRPMTCDGRTRSLTLRASGPPSSAGLPQQGETASCFIDAYRDDEPVLEAGKAVQVA